MSQPTYLFYDIETTGLNCAFDQVLQFAAIRTDLAFNELERHEIRVKLRPDVIPSPMAVMTHKISPSMMQEGEPEVDATRKIHALMNTPGTISLGYNTLGFDDEFLRFCFYRNLLPPYTHQFANRCKRMDLYPIATLFYLHGKSEIQWPEIDDRVSLKLENLNAFNQLATGQAHDAMVDVKATLALAKHFAKNTEMWDYCIGYFDKVTDAKRLSKLPYAFADNSYQQGIIVDGKFGFDQSFQTYAICLGTHYHYKNQQCWLRLDLPELEQSTCEEFEKTTWVVKKKLGEPPIVLPTIDRFKQHFTQERLLTMKQNRFFLYSNPDILEAITDHFLDYKYPLVPEADVDSVLYQAGFPSDHDTRLCHRFHEARLNEKSTLISEFQSPELQQLAIRLMGRNYPNLLKGDHLKQYDAYLQQLKTQEPPIMDYRKRPRFTAQDAQTQLTEIQASEDDKALNEELSLFINTLTKQKTV